jgi:hypothetical protein
MHSLVGKTLCSYGQIQKELVALIRSIGHGRFPNGYFSNNNERPECIPCYSKYFPKHVLIDCVDLVDIREILKRQHFFLICL